MSRCHSLIRFRVVCVSHRPSSTSTSLFRALFLCFACPPLLTTRRVQTPTFLSGEASAVGVSFGCMSQLGPAWTLEGIERRPVRFFLREDRNNLSTLALFLPARFLFVGQRQSDCVVADALGAASPACMRKGDNSPCRRSLPEIHLYAMYACTTPGGEYYLREGMCWKSSYHAMRVGVHLHTHVHDECVHT